MAKYAHVKDGAVLRIKELTAEEIALIPAHKQSYILPYIEVARPGFDSTTHYAPVRQPDDIQASQVVQMWAGAVAKTAGELDAEKDVIAGRMDVDPYLRAFALVMLDEINTLRALHSRPARTISQLKDAVKSKL